MDCNMPVMDGYQATKFLKGKMKKNEIPFIPIIAHTAYCIKSEEINFQQADFDDYLPKPFTMQQLKQKLDPYLNSPLYQ